MWEPHMDEDANEIAITSRFALLFQLLRDFFGNISEFHILCRIVALNDFVETSKGKIIRTGHLDRDWSEAQLVRPQEHANPQ
jgi:hypothetical protein